MVGVPLLNLSVPTLGICDVTKVKGLHLDLSLSVHPTTRDDPEIYRMHNPLGQVDAYWRFHERLSVGVRHTSSIPRHEDGWGLNEAYIKLHIW